MVLYFIIVNTPILYFDLCTHIKTMNNQKSLRLKFPNPSIKKKTNPFPISSTMAPPVLRSRLSTTPTKEKRRTSTKKTWKRHSSSKLSLSQTKASKETPKDMLIVALPCKAPPKPANPYLAIPTPKTNSPSTNLKALVIGIKEYNKRIVPDNQSILAAKSLPHTNKHEGLIDSVLEDYVKCLSSYKNNKWGHVLEYIPFDGPGSMIPCQGFSSSSVDRKTTTNCN